MVAVITAIRDSEEFRQLAQKTQRDYARMLDHFADFGLWPIEEFKRRHVRAIQSQLSNRPRTAKLFAQVASRLFSFAIELDLIDINPAARMKRIGSAVAYQAWSDDECATFERSITVPVLSPLRSYLDDLPLDTALFVTTAEGVAYDDSTFRHQFRSALDAAGLGHLHFHGLRHQAGRALAEAGCTEQEIMAILGHKTPAMAAHYCRAAEQRRLSRSAIGKWAASRGEADEDD